MANYLLKIMHCLASDLNLPSFNIHCQFEMLPLSQITELFPS